MNRGIVYSLVREMQRVFGEGAETEARGPETLRADVKLIVNIQSTELNLLSNK